MQQPRDDRHRDADTQRWRASVGDGCPGLHGCRGGRRCRLRRSGRDAGCVDRSRRRRTDRHRDLRLVGRLRRSRRATREVDRVRDERDRVHGHGRVHEDDGDLVERHRSTLRRRIRCGLRRERSDRLETAAARLGFETALARLLNPQIPRPGFETALARLLNPRIPSVPHRRACRRTPAPRPRVRGPHRGRDPRTRAPPCRRAGARPSPTCAGAARRARRAGRR